MCRIYLITNFSKVLTSVPTKDNFWLARIWRAIIFTRRATKYPSSVSELTLFYSHATQLSKAISLSISFRKPILYLSRHINMHVFHIYIYIYTYICLLHRTMMHQPLTTHFHPHDRSGSDPTLPQHDQSRLQKSHDAQIYQQHIIHMHVYMNRIAQGKIGNN